MLEGHLKSIDFSRVKCVCGLGRAVGTSTFALRASVLALSYDTIKRLDGQITRILQIWGCRSQKKVSDLFRYSCLIFWGISLTQLASAKITGDIELLTRIAHDYEVSFENIKTWQGKADIKGSTVSGKDGGVKQDWNDKVEFLLDRDITAFRWNRCTVEGTAQNQSFTFPLPRKHYFGITQDQYDYRIDYSNIGMASQKEPKILEIKEKTTITRDILSDTFDPIYIMENIGRFKLPEKLRYYYENANVLKTTEGTVTRDGDLVTFETMTQSEDTEIYGYISTRYVFDLSNGCNVIEHSRKNALNERHWQLDYEEISGVFVPKKIVMTYENKRPESKVISKREAILTTEMINQPVDISEFELEKIGLRFGDYVYISSGKDVLKYRWLKGSDTDQILLSKIELQKKVKANAKIPEKDKCCSVPLKNERK